ncbi:hypothetical protein HK102_001496 [Quaeritorhiza haematococci]|nr:hypothetical protein HK102_001496 [Quaeritorhiza haematococci]
MWVSVEFNKSTAVFTVPKKRWPWQPSPDSYAEFRKWILRNINPPPSFTIQYLHPAAGKRVQLTPDDRLGILSKIHGVQEYYVVTDVPEMVEPLGEAVLAPPVLPPIKADVVVLQPTVEERPQAQSQAQPQTQLSAQPEAPPQAPPQAQPQAPPQAPPQEKPAAEEQPAVEEQPEEEMQSDLGQFDPNWNCRWNRQDHDFFISYRVKSDAGHAEKLALELMSDEMRPHVYLDKRCLVAGKSFEDGFLNGLKRSRVIVLLISTGSLENVKHAHKYSDNMLLEWEYALNEVQTSSTPKEVIPLLVASERELSVDSKSKAWAIVKFSSFDTSVFADELPAHPRSTGKQTVRQIMTEIFKRQGIHYLPQEDENRSSVRARLFEHLSKLQSAQASLDPPPYLNPPSYSETGSGLRSYNLTAIEEQQIRQWLSPLGEEMSKEVQATAKRRLPGTRSWLLKQILEWCESDSRERLMWLQGQAGMGKTVMAGFIAEELQKRHLLGGAYFFKHNSNKRSNPASLVRTLAYDLAQWNLSFGKQLLQVYETEPDVIHSSIPKMFNKLILQPLNVINRGSPKPVVLVIDALDECGVKGSRQSILDVLAYECSKLLPDFVKIVLTSRLEDDIVAAFRDLGSKTLEPNNEQNLADIELYSRHIFRNRWHFRNQALENLVSKFSAASGGIFAWVTYAEKTLEQRLAASNLTNNARASQQIIEELLDHALSLPGDMSDLYNKTFRDDSLLEPKIITTLHILATLTDPLTPTGIAQLLQWDESDVNASLQSIQPLLSIEPETRLVRFFHKSVYDYLSDPTKCAIPILVLEEGRMDEELAIRCMQLMDRHLRRNVCSLPQKLLHKDIEEFSARVEKVFPQGEALRYAALHWTEHVWKSLGIDTTKTEPNAQDVTASSVVDLELYEILEKFLQNHIHHWFEVLSLLESFHTAIPFLQQLDKFWQVSVRSEPPSSSPRLSDSFPRIPAFITDGNRFAQTFNFPITQCAQQIYVSALPLSPTTSHISHLATPQQKDGPDAPALSQHDMQIIWGKDHAWARCTMTIRAHNLGVNAVAISPDNRLVVTGSTDTTAKVFDLTTGKEVRELCGHTASLRALAFTPDGKQLVTVSWDNTAKIWDMATGREVMTLYGHTDWVGTVAVSSDGRLIATGSNDVSAKIWDRRFGAMLKEFKGRHEGSVTAVAFSPDGRYLLTAGDDQMVRVCELETGQEVHALSGHKGMIFGLAVSPDSRYAVSGCGDETAKVWDLQSGKEVWELRGHSNVVFAVAFMPDGKQIVTVSLDRLAKLWDVETGKEVLALTDHTMAIDAVAASSDGRTLVTGSWDGTAKVWGDLKVREESVEFQGHKDSIWAIAASPDGKYVVTVALDKVAKVWEVATGKEVWELKGHTGPVYAVAVSADMRHVVTGSEDQTLRVWDLTTGEQVRCLEGHRKNILTLTISPNGKYIVSGSVDGTAKVWDLATGNLLQTLSGHSSYPIGSVEVTPDNLNVVTASSLDRTISIWDLSTGLHLRTLPTYFETINDLAVSPDGQYISAGSELSKMVRVWDITTGQIVQEFRWLGRFIPFSGAEYGAITLSKDGWIRDLESEEVVGWIPLTRCMACMTVDGEMVVTNQHALMRIKLNV